MLIIEVNGLIGVFVNVSIMNWLEGGLPQLHLAEDADVQWLMSQWLVIHTITTLDVAAV